MKHEVVKLQTIKSVRHGAVIEDYFDLKKSRRLVREVWYDDDMRWVVMTFAKAPDLPLVVSLANVAGMVFADEPPEAKPEPSPKKAAGKKAGLVPDGEYVRPTE